ncbi:S1 family peptidase [Pseudomonas ogarae]
MANGEPYDDAGPAVIQVHAFGTLKEAQNNSVDFDEFGTGFIVSPDGLILTAGHNIPDSALFKPGEFWVEAYLPKHDGDAIKADNPAVPLEVIKTAQIPHDVAILRIKKTEIPRPYLRLCDSYSMADKLVVLGYTGGDKYLSNTIGTVKIPAGAERPITMQLPLSPGDSGGPVFNQLGMVFGIAIGGKTSNLQRMEATTLAVPIAKAIATLDPASKSLLGVSYDPDCHKVLRSTYNAELVNYVLTKNPRDHLSALMPRPPSKFRIIDSHLSPPPGYRVLSANPVDIRSTEDGRKIMASTTIDYEGSSVHLTAKPFKSAPTVAISKIAVTLENFTVASSKPSFFQVRSFLLSNTLKEHRLVTTRRDFKSMISAPEGFIFTEYMNISYQSLSGSPSNGAVVAIAEGGGALIATYTLESGPIFNRKVGWIDAIITAKLRRID